MLRVTLHINAEHVADYEVRNLCQAASADPELCLYSVRPIIDNARVGEQVAAVLHSRREGAEVLASKALAEVVAARRRGAEQGESLEARQCREGCRSLAEDVIDAVYSQLLAQVASRVRAEVAEEIAQAILANCPGGRHCGCDCHAGIARRIGGA